MEQIKLKLIPKKILIIKPSSLGDIVHSLPFLDVMKTCFPQAKIHWVVAKGLEDLLECHPMIDRLWVINKDRWKNARMLPQTVKEFKTLYGGLRKEAYDIAIDLQGLLRSGLLIKATNARFRIGFREAKEGSALFYTHKITGGQDIHAVDRYLKIAAALGCVSEEVRFPMTLVKETENVSGIKSSFPEYAVLVPGARKVANRWPAEKYGHLAAMLPVKSLIVGSRADAAIANEIAGLSNGRAISLAGKTDIREMISVIRGARYVVSNDTGPMHIAAAFGIPVVAIFGPANPARTGPYGRNHVIVKAEVPCAPCYKRNCKKPICMEAVSVDMVYNTIQKI
ncbi:MAG: lipopolysaccharide heptosyltransferase I [Nitrospirae bacterium]|nr:MAG: lipopolysaccharide heptosyltransferase I [Nitrospirota bacterium]